MVAGELVARRRVRRGRDEPAARAAGAPAPVKSVTEEERMDAGAMVGRALGSLVRLRRCPVHRAGQLEVIERAPRERLESAVGAPDPVPTGAVGERDLDTQA